MSGPLKQRIIFFIALIIFIGVSPYFYYFLQERALHALPYGFKKFAVSDPLPHCGRWKEHMPVHRDPAAYKLYIDARNLWHSKPAWELTREENARILKDVSTAANQGDWGAQALMAHFYLQGLGGLEINNVLDPAPEKAVEIERLAVKAGQPWGFYDLGVAYEGGYGGVPQDDDLAWAYYLRAAELGSPDAQMALASAYGKAKRPANKEKMLQCAYRQDHGPAAYELALAAKIEKLHLEAVLLHQQGVRFGYYGSARALWLLFDNGYWTDSNKEAKAELVALGIHRDPERSRRYESIFDALKINPDLRLTRLDAALPLPPAELPDWNGVIDAVEPNSNGKPSY